MRARGSEGIRSREFITVMGRRSSPTPTQTLLPHQTRLIYNTCSFDHVLMMRMGRQMFQWIYRFTNKRVTNCYIFFIMVLNKYSSQINKLLIRVTQNQQSDNQSAPNNQYSAENNQLSVIQDATSASRIILHSSTSSP